MATAAVIKANPKLKNAKGIIRKIKDCYQLYIILLAPLAFVLIFYYYPMYGAQISFKDFEASKGIWGSQWVGLKYFIRFFNSPQFNIILTNTLFLNLYNLAAGFPIPIIIALSLNSVRSAKFMKTVQTTIYLPYFISTTVMVGLVLQFLSPRTGIVSQFISIFANKPVDIMSNPKLFRTVYVWSGIWQYAGWGTIIYLAALASVDPNINEAAIIDGASRMQRILHIDLPSIIPTAVILLIMNAGQIMNVGFEKVYLLQNPLNLHVSEVIQTFTYKVGLASAFPSYSYSTSIGLFNSLINLVVIIFVNEIAKKVGDTKLW